MIAEGVGAEASTNACVSSGWKSFRVLLPLLASLVIPLETKGRLYAACVKYGMVYGRKTWPLEEEDITRISKANKMWMYNVSLKDDRSWKRTQNDDDD